jgi:succinoglycan biosynthesis transport protein ExoP
MDPQHQWGLISRGNASAAPNGQQFSGSEPVAQETRFTWEQVIRVVRKNVIFILAFIAVATGIVGTASLLMKDFYQPVARVEVDPLSSGMKTLGEIQWNTDDNDENYVDTQTQLLQGDSLGVGVIRALRLDRNPEFVGNAWKQPGHSSETAAQENLEAPPADGFLQEQFDLANRTPLESAALGSFQKRLSVNTIHSTRVIEISFSSGDPALAQRVLNTLVTQYVDQNFQMRRTSSLQASDWLASRVEELRQNVVQSNQAVTN